MARLEGEPAAHMYEAAKQWLDRGLRADDSLFTAKRAVWTKANLDELYQRFVENWLGGPSSFMDKLQQQLHGAPAGVVQLSAELVFVHLLMPSDTSAPTKRERVNSILSWSAEPVVVPADLDAAFEGGVAAVGVAKAQMPAHVRFLLEFARSWKELPPGRREEALSDPWSFKQIVFEVPASSAFVQREALLHLAYPEAFESIVARDWKTQIVHRWQKLAGDSTADIDQQLLSIRRSLESTYGATFTFYDPPILSQWRPTQPPGPPVPPQVPDREPLDRRIASELRALRDKFLQDGILLSGDQQNAAYASFLQHFGPDALSRLDGQTLLETLHLHGNKESLVYWLEFKDDDELPGRFGSIAGGSALKFGIYRRNETGEWMTGSPEAQRKLTLDEAVQIARAHRDQLLAGARLLEHVPAHGSDVDYAALQQDLEAAAPDVAETSWGHKYFFLLYPTKLDDFHNPEYQRYQLIRLLQLPPSGSGRYLVAGRFVALADELDMPMNHLTTVLFRRNGPPRHYWRLEARSLDTGQSHWEEMLQGQYVALGWPKLGDLKGVEYKQKSKDLIRQRMQNSYPGPTVGRATQQVFNFATRLRQGDIIAAAERDNVLAIGRVAGEYQFDASSEFAHQRPVEWLHVDHWKLPTSDTAGAAFTQISKDPANLIQIEERLLEPVAKPKAPGEGVPKPGPVPTLPGHAGRIQRALERKGQVILYGPPGTGKTYWARTTANDLASLHSFGRRFDELTSEQQQVVAGGANSLGLVRSVTFHPSYGYEDFLEGYRPAPRVGQMVFELREGIFRRLCQEAAKSPDRRFYLLIDEINRGDIPRIFGELLTVLERDKRNQPVVLGVSGEPMCVPNNVYVVGTMNTADRSIALVDVALRRRFAFVELMPDPTLLGQVSVAGIPLRPWLAALNDRIRQYAGRDARNLQIGHAYLLDDGAPVADFDRFVQILWDDIIPLLEEYTYEDYAALEKILGAGLVDLERQRIREELFDPARQVELVQQLLVSSPAITTSTQAVAAEAEAEAIASESDEQQLIDQPATPSVNC